MAAATVVAAGGRQAPPQGLRIDVRRVSEAVHRKYSEMVAEMVQENGELTAAYQTAMERIAELEAQVEALRGARGTPTVKPEVSTADV